MVVLITPAYGASLGSRRPPLTSARPGLPAAPPARPSRRNPPSSAQRDRNRDHRQSEAQEPKPRRPRVGVDVLRPVVADDEQQPDHEQVGEAQRQPRMIDDQKRQRRW